jgi:hypothetical protein
MRVTMTSAAARTGHANEDFTGAVPTAVVLIDGAGIPGTESICRHGAAWYAAASEAASTASCQCGGTAAHRRCSPRPSSR